MSVRPVISIAVLTLTAVSIFIQTGTAHGLELDGFIEPALVVNIGSNVSGIIEKIHVERGDIVKEGQILATLDSRLEKASVKLIQKRSEMEAARTLAKARIDFAKREHTRRQELFEKGIIPDYEMDEAETNLLIAQGELREVEEQIEISWFELKQAETILARKTIRSPIDGIVVERYLAPGELTSDRPLVKLAKLNPLHVEVIAPVSMLGSIKVGKKAEVRPEEQGGRSYTGRVTIVDRVVDAASGTFGIRVELANKDLSIPAGLKCRVNFLQ